MGPVDELAKSLLVALRPDFAEREQTARQLAELLLDAVAAALPLTRHEPAEAPLRELEALASQADVYAWDGAPGWDVVLERGLGERAALEAGPSVLDGLGAKSERTQQRGELKRRAHAQATVLVGLAREAARFDAGAQSAGARVTEEPALPATGGARRGGAAIDQLPATAALLAAHAALLRLVGLGAASRLLLTAEDANASALPPSAEEQLLRELDERGEGFLSAQEEWIARLLAKNPAAAAAPAFRTFYAGLSQSLRAAPALRRFRDDARDGRLAGDPEALLAAVASWQPIRWPSLRSGAPSAWLVELCTPAPAEEMPLRRLERECSAGLDLFSRLWFAENLTPAAFTALAALLISRCASIVALWEEMGGGKPAS